MKSYFILSLIMLICGACVVTGGQQTPPASQPAQPSSQTAPPTAETTPERPSLPPERPAMTAEVTPTPQPQPAKPNGQPLPPPRPTPQTTPTPQPQPAKPNGQPLPPPRPTDTGSQPNLNGFKVAIERTPCFGACPVYTLTIEANGTVVFHGKRFTATQGSAKAAVSADTVSKLYTAVKAAGFFQLSDCYCERKVTDMPSVNVTVTMNGRTKTVKHYTGDKSAPDALLTLQDRIDTLVNSARWVKGVVK